MKFPVIQGGFATVFNYKKLTNNVRYKVIRKDLYQYLTKSDLKNVRVNEKNFIELKKSTSIGLCTNCMCEITSKHDAKHCSIDGCLYKTYLRYIYIYIYISLIAKITAVIVKNQVNI